MEHHLTEKESLDLIARTIEQTRSRVEQKAALPMLIFGYVSVLTSLLIWILITRTADYRYHFLWCGIPVVGWALFLILRKGRTQAVQMPQSHMRRLIARYWLLLSGVFILLMGVAFLQKGFDSSFLFILLVGLGVATTGLIVDYKPYVVCGILGVVLSVVLPWLPGNTYLLGLAVLFAVVMVIPGHVMHRALQKNKTNHA